VFLLRRFEYMNEHLFPYFNLLPIPTWPSLFRPLTLGTTCPSSRSSFKWLFTFVQPIPSQLLRRPSQTQLVYVFPSTRNDVPTIGGDHVNLNRVNFAHSGMTMGALAHSLCSLSSLPTPSMTGRNPQFADLAYRRSSNPTYYMFSVPAFARSCCAFPRLIWDVIRRVASRPTRGRCRRFRGMPELLRRSAVYHLAFLREISATGHHHRDRVNLHTIHVRPRAQVTGVLPARRPAFRSLNARHCFLRPPTLLIILGWFLRNASQSDISRSYFLPLSFSFVTHRTYYLEIIQQPEVSAEFGTAALSRLPLAPPLVAQLIIRDSLGNVIES
jgi:hypothetical protein